jgi:peptidylprolyl isomerase
LGNLNYTTKPSIYLIVKELLMIENGTAVKVHYKGTLDDGSVFDTSENRDALAFTIGAGQVIGGFDAAVRNMDVGTTKTVTIPCAEAYGEHNENLVLTLPHSQFPETIEPKVGLALQLTTPHGPLVARVTAIGDDGVMLDGNHPLAGQNLTFELTLVEAG